MYMKKNYTIHKVLIINPKDSTNKSIGLKSIYKNLQTHFKIMIYHNDLSGICLSSIK